MQTRDTIFISHATPEDNEFAIWIASRLQMLGYNVWVDKNGLLGGERFWPTIQKVISTSSKILLVYSKNIINTEGTLKTGVENELDYGKSIAQDNRIKDFIIPLHIDNTPHNSIIGITNINHIPFESNWANGLKQLLLKLEKDDVPKSPLSSQSSFSEWYENEYSSNIIVKEQKRLYYSSWWGFQTLPQVFYVFKFKSTEQAKFIRTRNPEIPMNLNNNIITCFEQNLNTSEEDGNPWSSNITPESIDTYSLDDLRLPENSKTFNDAINAYKRLMMSIWNSLLRQKGLSKYIISGKRQAYYWPLFDKRNEKVTFTYPYSNRIKRKRLLGKYKSFMWHYAISARVLLDPIPCFLVKSHIVFTTDGKTPIEDEKKMHTYRRDKAKHFFNEEWRDLFLGMIQSLRNKDGKISIKIDYNQNCLELNTWPELFSSHYDYQDPNKIMSNDNLIDNFVDEDNTENDEA